MLSSLRAVPCVALPKVLRATANSWHHGHAVIMDAARSGGLDTFKIMVKILDKKLSMQQVTSGRWGGGGTHRLKETVAVPLS